MENEKLQNELQTIRQLMERSAKFVSLSGLSGVLMGVFALIGASCAYAVLHNELLLSTQVIWLIVIASLVLLCSVGTCLVLTARKAGRLKQSVWNPASRALLSAMSIPLLTGGLFVLLCLYAAYFDLIAAACLIFYGLSLVTGGQFTFNDIRILGVLQILLGLIAFALPHLGLYLWAIGFGILHIIYGVHMHFKYDRRTI